MDANLRVDLGGGDDPGPDFINEEWFKAFLGRFPVRQEDEDSEPVLRLDLRVIDPTLLLVDVEQYLLAIHDYFVAITGSDKGTPVAEIWRAIEALDDAGWWFDDDGSEEEHPGRG